MAAKKKLNWLTKIPNGILRLTLFNCPAEMDRLESNLCTHLVYSYLYQIFEGQILRMQKHFQLDIQKGVIWPPSPNLQRLRLGRLEMEKSSCRSEANISADRKNHESLKTTGKLGQSGRTPRNHVRHTSFHWSNGDVEHEHKRVRCFFCPRKNCFCSSNCCRNNSKTTKGYVIINLRFEIFDVFEEKPKSFDHFAALDNPKKWSNFPCPRP